MCKDQKFFICKHCGNIVGMIFASGVPVVCCGENMHELVPNTVEASVEKHLPVVTVDHGVVTVAVGSTPHPMIAEHHIEWVYLQTELGGQRKCLEVGGKPVAAFAITDDDKPVAAFAYCNLHGLWKTDF